MKKLPIFLCILAIAVFILTTHLNAASIATETWDTGLNLWSGNVAWTTLVEHRTPGGNPGGYMYIEGSDNPGAQPSAFTAASAPYIGDYSAIPIIGVSFDLNYYSGQLNQTWLRFRYQDASFNGWHFPLSVLPTQGAGWESFSVFFDPFWTDIEAEAAGWVQESTSPAFSTTMADVYSAEIRFIGQSIEMGIDNFGTKPIPEPTTLLLFGTGLVVVAGFGRKKLFKK